MSPRGSEACEIEPLSDMELFELRAERAHADLWDSETVDRIFATIDALKAKLLRQNDHDCYPRDGGDL